MRWGCDHLSRGISEPRDATQQVVLPVSPETSSQLLARGLFRLRRHRNSGLRDVLTCGGLGVAQDILAILGSSLLMFGFCFDRRRRNMRIPPVTCLPGADLTRAPPLVGSGRALAAGTVVTCSSDEWLRQLDSRNDASAGGAAGARAGGQPTRCRGGGARKSASPLSGRWPRRR